MGGRNFETNPMAKGGVISGRVVRVSQRLVVDIELFRGTAARVTL
jgi:hypothetical protein